ncbi:flavodoxin family protein [Methanocella sp. MCL-LM]|uniref:flavodoxin family protein n=1 Tax=Methanocella sp. MCL-LM TaxID=3412035 RepID=UPI003C712FC8
MKIGIIVYSQTGNTFSVAGKLKDKLTAAGHSATVERIVPTSGEKDGKNVKFGRLPDLTQYEGLVFAAPVQAFSLSAVMAAYLKQLPSLSGKKIACFVTKGLPFAWTGGNSAIGKLTKECEARGGTVGATGIVVWRGANRDKNIADVVDAISKAF